MRIRSTTLASGAVALAAALALAGCSSTGDSDGGPKPDSGTSSAVPTPMQRLKAAKKVMDETSGMHLVLTSTGVPKGVSAVLKGEGDGSHAPAFKGNLTAQIGSISAKVPVRAVGGKVYAKLPIWPTMKAIDPGDYGAPDPAQLFSTDRGISSLLPQTKQASFGDTKRDGADTVQVIKGTLPGSALTSVMSIGKSSQTYNVTYEITDDNQLRDVVVTGPFFAEGKQVGYELKLTEYGEKVDVKAP